MNAGPATEAVYIILGLNPAAPYNASRMCLEISVKNRHDIARLVLGIALSAVALWIGSTFIPAVLWAGVVTVAVDPLRKRLLARLPGRHSIVAGVLTVAIALLVIIPAAVLIAQAANEARSLISWYGAASRNGIPVPLWVYNIPFGSQEVAAWWNTHLATPDAAAAQLQHLDTGTLIEHSKAIGHNLLRRVVIFSFTVITLFFLLRDRDRVLAQIQIAAYRTFGPAGERIGTQILASIRGTIDGLVLVSLVESVIMALVYLVAGVPHPLLLGAVTGLGGMIPFGLLAVMCIAVLLLILKGSIAGAIAVAAIGIVVNFVADHFVRPTLIGAGTQLPFIWVLIGIIGGVETLGLVGLFVGPAVMATLVLLWRDYVAEKEPGRETQDL